MIKNRSGEKCTPKQLAKEIFTLKVKSVVETDASYDPESLTEKERALVNEQLEKVRGRLLKTLGDKDE